MAFSDDLTDLLTTGLRLRLHDSFLSSGAWSSTVSQTGAATFALAHLKASTGIQQGSVARPYYTRNVFNPLYGKLRIKLRLNEAASTFFFMGFKHTAAAPSWHMTESHVGIMLYQGTLYLTTGNGDPSYPAFQVTAIPSFSMSDWHVYEIAATSFRYWTVPCTVPYFDANVLPSLKEGMIRKWSPWYRNLNTLPDDTVHYLVLHVENLVGSTRYCEAEFIDYQEVYPD